MSKTGIVTRIVIRTCSYRNICLNSRCIVIFSKIYLQTVFQSINPYSRLVIFHSFETVTLSIRLFLCFKFLCGCVKHHKKRKRNKNFLHMKLITLITLVSTVFVSLQIVHTIKQLHLRLIYN